MKIVSRTRWMGELGSVCIQYRKQGMLPKGQRSIVGTQRMVYLPIFPLICLHFCSFNPDTCPSFCNLLTPSTLLVPRLPGSYVAPATSPLSRPHCEESLPRLVRPQRVLSPVNPLSLPSSRSPPRGMRIPETVRILKQCGTLPGTRGASMPGASSGKQAKLCWLGDKPHGNERKYQVWEEYKTVAKTE